MAGKRKAGWHAAAVVTALCFIGPASAQDAGLFQRLGGGWSGAGSVRLPGGGVERIRCRGRYAGGGSRLHIDLGCASDSFKVQVAADMAREGDRVSGSWSEAGSGAAGSLNGVVRGDGIGASFSGPGAGGTLSLALHGSTQTVTLVSQSVIAGSATVTLHRE